MIRTWLAGMLPVIVLALSCSGSNANGPDASSPGPDASSSPDVTLAVPDLPAFEPPEKNAIVGRVVSLSGRPVAGATVALDSGKTATTNYDGYYFFADVAPADRLIVRFSAPGYLTTSRTVSTFQDGRSIVNAVLSPRAAALPLANGPVVFGHGTVSIKDSDVVDKDGKATSSPISVRVTPIPTRGAGIAAAPGDFSATTAGGKVAQLETFAIADYQLSDADGNELKVKDGAKATIEMLLPPDTTLKAGDTVPAWRFDEATGRWVEEGSGTVKAYSQDPSRLAFVAEVGHFSTWNCDNPMETTCISGIVTKCDGTPVPVPDLVAQGVDYDGTSSDWGAMDGSFCLPARTGSTVNVVAAYGYPPNRLVGMTTVTTGTATSSCPGPCTQANIQLPCTPAESKVDCSDNYFAGCKSCVRGRVVDKKGVPQAAVLQASTGLSTFTVVTDEKGYYCTPAAMGKLVTISASTTTGRAGSTSTVPVSTGACPSCEVAPDLVLSNAAGADEALDFSKCPALIGGMKLDSVVVNGADPVLASLDSGFATLSIKSDDKGNPTGWMLELVVVSSKAMSLTGNPVVYATLTGEGFPPGAATYDVASADLKAHGHSALGMLVGIGGETYSLDQQSGTGSVRLDSGFAKVGDPVKGSFDLVLGPDCGPRGASIALRGTLDLKVTKAVGLIPDVSSPGTIEAYKCGLIGLFFLALELQTTTGMSQVSLDGMALTGTQNILNSVKYSWDSDTLSLNYYNDDKSLMLRVQHPMSGENVIQSGTLIVGGADCSYTLKGGTMTLETFNGAEVERWLTGSFHAEFSPASFSSGTDCVSHVADGQFGAAVCR